MSGHINPNRDSFKLFRDLPRDAPVNMLNLVRVRDRAVYEDGRDLSGHEAYSLYGQQSKPVLDRIGGSILWRGRFETMLIGPSDEHWDYCFIAHYPTASAFLEMLRDPVYQEAVVHRTAAVADSRLIRTGALPAGVDFAS